MAKERSDSEQYKAIARDANFEVYQLAVFLRDALASCPVTWEGDRAVRGICQRLTELSNIVYESYLVDDEPTALDELMRRLGVEHV
jgi:hypothetical protein